MTRNWTNGAKKPLPEQLSAYLDGELDAAASRECAAWLAAHPEAAADLDGWRRLNRVWETTAPPEPSSAAWSSVLAGIEKAVPRRPPLPVPKGRTILRWVAGLVAAAAVVAALLSARTLLQPPQQPDQTPEVALTPYPVAEAHEVVILSMDARDVDALVVARPPVTGPIVFAAHEDIRIIGTAPWPGDGSVPQLGKDMDLPMIVALQDPQ
jgi:anti-sigma factor RsiW